jgi:3D (Asp-Asp-Asp) domain-containing protein
MREKQKKGAKPLALALCLAAFLANALLFVDFVSIEDSRGLKKGVATFSRSHEKILRQAGVEIGPNDTVSYEAGILTAKVAIDRTFPVFIFSDGARQELRVDSGMVGDALRAVGVGVGNRDIVSPPVSAPLRKGMEIAVKRVAHASETLRLEVSDEDVKKYLDGLSKEKRSAFQKSKSSIYDVTRTAVYIDGVRQKGAEAVASLEAVVHPYDEPHEEIFTGRPLSTIDGFVGVEVGEDGFPLQWKRKMEGAVCTAYSASNGRGAGGLGLYCGTVAVDSKAIPYGTRLFIASSDRKFVYGFAIASDTGGAMMEGRVDIDLYFESNKECRAFGKRRLDVYVLD